MIYLFLYGKHTTLPLSQSVTLNSSLTHSLSRPLNQSIDQSLPSPFHSTPLRILTYSERASEETAISHCQ